MRQALSLMSASCTACAGSLHAPPHRLGALSPAEMQKVDDALRSRLGLWICSPVTFHQSPVTASARPSPRSSGFWPLPRPPFGLPAVSTIRTANMEDLYVPVGSVFPKMDRETRVNMDVEQASFAVRFSVVRILVRILADFAETFPKDFLLAPRERRREIEHFHRDQETIFHSEPFGGRPSRCPNSSSVTQFPGVRSSIFRAIFSAKSGSSCRRRSETTSACSLRKFPASQVAISC